MKPLRFGIVGCGGIAAAHAECLKGLEEEGLVHLVAGAETVASRRKEFGEKWQMAMHEDLAGLLARDDIDAVCVCSVSGLHGEQSTQIAKSGRHVLCEKPLDLVLAKADQAIQAASDHHVVLGGIFQERFQPDVLKVKRAIDAGYFGQIVFVHTETPWYRSQEYYDSGAWRGTWALDGGVLANQAPHMIDLMLWLGGDISEVLAATCEAGRDRNIEAETQAAAILRFKNGALGTITGTTLAYEGLDRHMFVCGTEGCASLTEGSLTAFKTKSPFEEDKTLVMDARGNSSGAASTPLAIASERHKENIRDFILAVQEGRAPMVSDEDMRRMVRALNMIYAKAGVGPYAGLNVT